MGRVLQSYEDELTRGEIDPDAAQRAVALRLDELAQALETKAAASGLLSAFLKLTNRPEPVRGVYIHGSVGRGKTMLMDLFFEEVALQAKMRAHFHEFMADVHERIGEARKSVPGDPIPHVAAQIAKNARLLCFDEMHVTDIADAMILGRLFQGLIAAGTTIVATSNAHPNALYRNGLNRQLFVPFIHHLQMHMDVVALDAQKDYRLEKLSGAPLYFTPNDAAAKAAMDAHFTRLTGGHPAKPHTIEFKGRKLVVPAAAMGVARLPFADLCEKPLGSLDFLHLAHAFHTIMIDGIPKLSAERRDIARRFINLVDTLYDNSNSLIASAEAEPKDLYPNGPGADLFERTVSRLMEMRSEGYLARRMGKAG
jgi:cell division protein ZapE